MSHLGTKERSVTLVESATIAAIIALMSVLFSGCGGEDIDLGTTDSSSSSGGTSKTNSLRVSFHYLDYYSLLDANDYHCSGDLKTMYEANTEATDATADISRSIAAAEPFTSKSEWPAFIKNVSVDITDSNVNNDQNEAYSCSYGNGSSVPPVSNCATFDYAAMSGISSTQGGSFVVLGGLTSSNYGGTVSATSSISCGPQTSTSLVSGETGYNSCSISNYGLGIDGLPAAAATDPVNSLTPGLTSADNPISSFVTLSNSTNYDGPLGVTAGSITYNPNVKKLLVFGGTKPFSTSSTFGYDTSDTWIFNMTTQSWSQVLGNNSTLSGSVVTDNSLLYTLDVSQGYDIDLQKSEGGRANFGFVAVPNTALKTPSTDGTISTATIDTSDRILIIDGVSPNGVMKNTLRFNPTFGPSIIDIYKYAATTPAAGSLIQWIDSFHTQLLSNMAATSLHTITLDVNGDGATTDGSGSIVNAAYAPILIQDGTNTYGSVISIGGSDNSASETSATQSTNNVKYIKRNTTATQSGDFSFVPNDVDGNSLAPLVWTDLPSDDGSNTTAWYGGATLLNGFSLADNDVAYFGGATCRNYLTDSSASCTVSTSSRYWRLGANLTADLDNLTNITGTAPNRVGMAAARGEDGGGNVILVAWGGMSAPATTSGDSVYVMYNTGTTTSPAPTWGTLTPTGSLPVAAANAALVYSHVTRKFYLFGGYQTSGSTGVRNDTWELTVTGTCPSCTFSWQPLDVDGGLTCTPDCPAGRRSHKMVEVNLNHTNPTSEPTCTSADSPCSFMILMQGGTSDGSSYYSDKWMFDPTANGGAGHWQKVGDIPPRRLATSATVDYYIPIQNKTAHRAVVFGGEFGLHSPSKAATSAAGDARFFVAPTLADTWIYDFDESSFHRVDLQGQVYKTSVPATLSYGQTIGATTTAGTLFSPPAVAGATMVTRTLPRGSSVSGSTKVEALRIPEVFMIGGRLQDGTFNSFDRVWKFCMGTRGEDTVDYSCDADYDNTNSDHDADDNPGKEYKGRWIPKTIAATTDITPASIKAYGLGGVYDPLRDKIIVFGGLSASTAITSTTSRTALNTMYEYSPPSAAKPNGSWASVAACTSGSEPSGRYGHTMGFDSLTGQVIVMGGYDINGALLTQTQITSSGDTYTIPDVWAAKKIAAGDCYKWEQKTTFGNDPDIVTQAPPGTGLAWATSTYLPPQGYNTGFYSMFDESCAEAGPIASGDASTSKLMAGGVYIDIDRSQLSDRENMILHLTYVPLGERNRKPSGVNYDTTEAALFKIHLQTTNLSADAIQAELQPRHLAYASDKVFPKTVETLSVLSPPTGSMRQDQILIPLSSDPNIDRIRIERYSGSAILIDATLYRLGAK